MRPARPTGVVVLVLVAIVASHPASTSTGSSSRRTSEPPSADGDVQPPRLIHKVDPEYPDAARQNRVSGEVILLAIVDADGRVQIQGVVTGHAALREAAVHALAQWRYEPATRDGEPVAVRMAVTVRFSLDSVDTIVRRRSATAGADEMRMALEGWKIALDDNAQRLREGEHGPALRAARKIIDQLLRRVGAGEAAAAYLATATAQRALASAGLGDEADARWYWRVAAAIHPRIAEADLSSFGPGGVRLAAILEREIEGVVLPKEERPRVRREVQPEYPAGARTFGLRGSVLLGAVLTDYGGPIEPRLLVSSPGPTLTYAALEAFRKWRWEPVIREGQPVRARIHAEIVFD